MRLPHLPSPQIPRNRGRKAVEEDFCEVVGREGRFGGEPVEAEARKSVAVEADCAFKSGCERFCTEAFLDFGGEQVDVDFLHVGQKGVVPARVAERVQKKAALFGKVPRPFPQRVLPAVAVRADFLHDFERVLRIAPHNQVVFVAKVVVKSDGGDGAVGGDFAHGDFVDGLLRGKLHERGDDEFFCGQAGLHVDEYSRFWEIVQQALRAAFEPAEGVAENGSVADAWSEGETSPFL